MKRSTLNTVKISMLCVRAAALRMPPHALFDLNRELQRLRGTVDADRRTVAGDGWRAASSFACHCAAISAIVAATQAGNLLVAQQHAQLARMDQSDQLARGIRPGRVYALKTRSAATMLFIVGTGTPASRCST